MLKLRFMQITTFTYLLLTVSFQLHIVDMAGTDAIGNPSCSFKSIPHIAGANLMKMNIEQFLLCLMSKSLVCDKLKERLNPFLFYLDGDLTTQNIIR